MTGSWAERAVAVSIGVLLTIVAGLVLLPGLRFGPSLDASVFTIVADRLRAGDVPYRDLFDHKPPGIFLFDAAVQSLVGGSAWSGSWVGSVLALGLTGALAGSIAVRSSASIGTRRLSDSLALRVGVGLLTVTFLGAPRLALGGGMTEAVGALPAAASVWAALCGSAGGRGATWWFVAAGAFASAAVATSFFFAPVVVAAGILGWGAAHRTLAYLAGLALVAAALALWLVAAGAMPAAIDALIGFNAAYIGVSLGDPRGTATGALLAIAPLLAAAVAFSFMHRPSRLSLALVAWCAMSVLQLILPGRFATHYLLPVVLPLCLLAAMGVASLGHRAGLLAGSVLAAASVVIMVSQVGSPVPQQPLRSATIGLGEWLQRNTEPTDRILVWDRLPQVYLTAQRAPAGRFIHRGALRIPEYARSATAEWIRGLEADLPAAIIVLKRQWGPGEASAALRALVSASYVELPEVAGRRIFVPADRNGGD